MKIQALSLVVLAAVFTAVEMQAPRPSQRTQMPVSGGQSLPVSGGNPNVPTAEQALEKSTQGQVATQAQANQAIANNPAGAAAAAIAVAGPLAAGAVADPIVLSYLNNTPVPVVNSNKANLGRLGARK